MAEPIISDLAHRTRISLSIKGVETDVATIVAADLVRSKHDADFTNFIQADPATFQYNIGETEQKIIKILLHDILRKFGKTILFLLYIAGAGVETGDGHSGL